ncbi:unnamed protein product [Heterobilharzia americana]|nr:unnamed protein product [Heterobilharzia americana]
MCENEKLWTSEKLQSRIFRHNDISSTIWKTVTLSLISSNDQISRDYKLILEGTIPAGYPDARICVDNITSYTEPCSALEKASAPLPSQWSWLNTWIDICWCFDLRIVNPSTIFDYPHLGLSSSTSSYNAFELYK